MSDFVDYQPGRRLPRPAATVEIRSALPQDADALATVMSARGGVVEDHAGQAARLIERLDVLLIAETRSAAVGWCGIQRFAIRPDAEPEWLIAGLTVIPEARRRGVAARLLHEVLRLTGEAAPGESIFSVINARNPASIDLHEGLGFVEVERAASLAGIEFTGGEGVLLRYSWPSVA